MFENVKRSIDEMKRNGAIKVSWHVSVKPGSICLLPSNKRFIPLSFLTIQINQPLSRYPRYLSNQCQSVTLYIATLVIKFVYIFSTVHYENFSGDLSLHTLSMVTIKNSPLVTIDYDSFRFPRSLRKGVIRASVHLYPSRQNSTKSIQIRW